MEKKERKVTRLPEYDYSSAGAYFVTICTKNRQCFLSKIVGAIHESPLVELMPYGRIVDAIIVRLPDRYGIKIDNYVIMPNHIHLLISIEAEFSNGAIRESPLQKHSTISKVIGYLKMNASKEIHKHGYVDQIWQRGFYDHVVRNDDDYDAIWQYIDENPIKWELDKFYKTR